MSLLIATRRALVARSPVREASLPYDSLATLAGLWSLRRVRSSYTGNLIRLRKGSGGGATEQDFGYLANGDLDVASILSWLSGGQGYYKTIYDQIGSNNLTQSTEANQPLFVADATNGRPAIWYPGNVSAMSLVTPSMAHFPSKRGALSAVYASDFTIQTQLAATFNGAGSNFLWYTTQSNVGTKHKYFDGSQRTAASYDTNALARDIINRSADTSLELWKDGSLLETIAVGNNQPANNALYLGNISSLSGTFDGLIFEFLEFSSALSSGDVAALEAARSAYYPALDRHNIVCDGDSLTAGSQGTPYPTQMRASYDHTYRIANYGIGGQTLSSMSGDAATQIDPTLTGGNTNILCAFGGTNDLFFGASAATAITRYETYCAARQAAGWQVVAFTMLPRSDTSTPGSFETDRQTFNTSVRANWQNYADALADVAADTRIGDEGDELDSTYYNTDKVHPKTAGYAIIASIASAAINTLI